MIAFLRGTLVSGGESLILEVGGIGFAVQVSARTAQRLPSPGSSLSLHTLMQVRQDGIGLYGFLEAPERELFQLLQEVGGLGPKVALQLLSAYSWGKLAELIGSGDVSALVRVQGVGPKLAQRIVLELKDKIRRRGLGGEETGGVPSSNEALAALVALGYTSAEAEPVVTEARRALGDEASLEEVVAYCLKAFGGHGRQ